MNSRMERYNSEVDIDEATTNNTSSRVSRNNSLYHDIKTNELSRVRSNDNIKVIENSGKTIDLEKIRRYITEINEPPKTHRRSVRIEAHAESQNFDVEDNVPKDYDINSVLEKAKKTREIDYDRERYKKLRSTEYDILSKIDMYDNKEEELIDNLQEEFNTDERTLIDLINTVTIHKGDVNLLEELIGDDEDDVTDPIKEEVQKNDIKREIREINQKEFEDTIQDNVPPLENTMKVDNSFYTNSMSFSKDDFEGFEELEKSVKKNSIFSTILILVFVIFIIVTLVIVANYVFELGLF